MSDSFDVPMIKHITVQIILMLLCMNLEWTLAIIGVEGAFLRGIFENSKELYVEVPMVWRNII